MQRDSAQVIKKGLLFLILCTAVNSISPVSTIPTNSSEIILPSIRDGYSITKKIIYPSLQDNFPELRREKDAEKDIQVVSLKNAAANTTELKKSEIKQKGFQKLNKQTTEYSGKQQANKNREGIEKQQKLELKRYQSEQLLTEGNKRNDQKNIKREIKKKASTQVAKLKQKRLELIKRGQQKQLQENFEKADEGVENKQITNQEKEINEKYQKQVGNLKQIMNKLLKNQKKEEDDSQEDQEDVTEEQKKQKVQTNKATNLKIEDEQQEEKQANAAVLKSKQDEDYPTFTKKAAKLRAEEEQKEEKQANAAVLKSKQDEEYPTFTKKAAKLRAEEEQKEEKQANAAALKSKQDQDYPTFTKNFPKTKYQKQLSQFKNQNTASNQNQTLTTHQQSLTKTFTSKPTKSYYPSTFKQSHPNEYVSVPSSLLKPEKLSSSIPSLIKPSDRQKLLRQIQKDQLLQLNTNSGTLFEKATKNINQNDVKFSQKYKASETKLSSRDKKNIQDSYKDKDQLQSIIQQNKFSQKLLDKQKKSKLSPARMPKSDNQDNMKELLFQKWTQNNQNQKKLAKEKELDRSKRVRQYDQLELQEGERERKLKNQEEKGIKKKSHYEKKLQIKKKFDLEMKKLQEQRIQEQQQFQEEKKLKQEFDKKLKQARRQEFLRKKEEERKKYEESLKEQQAEQKQVKNKQGDGQDYEVKDWDPNGVERKKKLNKEKEDLYSSPDPNDPLVRLTTTAKADHKKANQIGYIQNILEYKQMTKEETNQLYKDQYPDYDSESWVIWFVVIVIVLGVIVVGILKKSKWLIKQSGEYNDEEERVTLPTSQDNE